jgi:hypothetical protein
VRAVVGQFAMAASLFVGAMVYGQEIPEFDYADFEVVDVLANSKVHARSNGSDFYCSAAVDGMSGFVVVDGCLPFVGLVGGVPAAEVSAATIEEAAAAADAAAAAAAVAKQEDLLDVLEALDSVAVEEAILLVAKRSGCQLYVRGGAIANSSRLLEIMAEVGIPAHLIDPASSEVASKRFGSIIATLAERGEVEIAQQGKLMKIKDCN